MKFNLFFNKSSMPIIVLRAGKPNPKNIKKIATMLFITKEEFFLNMRHQHKILFLFMRLFDVGLGFAFKEDVTTKEGNKTLK